MRIAILHDDVPPDAAPDQRDVLDQVEAVAAALVASGHEIRILPVGLDLEQARSSLVGARADRAFNLVESLDGDDRGIVVVPALLERTGVPYTGAPLAAILMTTHKVVAKRLLLAASLPTPPWYAAGESDEAIEALVPGRVIVKSVWDHASRALDEDDVVDVGSPEALRSSLARRGAARGERFAEQYVHGREFNLSLLAGPGGGVEVLPPAEIRFRGWAADRPRVVGYRAKWVPDSFEYANTVRGFDFEPADAALLAELERLARACWLRFGLRGYARVDFRVDEHGRPLILEANVNPCLTPDAGFAAALDRAGIPYGVAIERIVEDCSR